MGCVGQAATSAKHCLTDSRLYTPESDPVYRGTGMLGPLSRLCNFAVQAVIERDSRINRDRGRRSALPAVPM